MTLSQMEKRLVVLERTVDTLREQLDYQRAVEGIRRGLESADRGEGESARKAFAAIRRRHNLPRRR